MRYISDEAPALRSSALVSRDMQLALTLDESVNGIKGPSAMMNLPGLPLLSFNTPALQLCQVLMCENVYCVTMLQCNT